MTSEHRRKKNVLITGCTTGSIGHALALEFHAQGFRVIASSRSLATMSDLVEHELIDTVQLDVCSSENILKAKAEIENLTDGRLDYLVNNAGGPACSAPAVELDLDRAKEEFDVNFWGAVRMVEAFTPLLMQSAAGHIVNISTTASVVPVPYLSVYGSAKAALNQYADVLRVELAPFNISVTTIITGAISNSRNQAGAGPEGQMQLRPGSIYTAGLQGHRKVYENLGGRTRCEDYARQVVKQVTRDKPKMWLYAGSYSTLTWLMQIFFPRWLIISANVDAFGLKKVSNSLDAQAKKAA